MQLLGRFVMRFKPFFIAANLKESSIDSPFVVEKADLRFSARQIQHFSQNML